MDPLYTDFWTSPKPRDEQSWILMDRDNGRLVSTAASQRSLTNAITHGTIASRIIQVYREILRDTALF